MKETIRNKKQDYKPTAIEGLLLQTLSFLTLLISCSFFFFIFSLFSFILAWTFISLQIKEFRIMCLSINDSVNICLFFFLTVLHFFHLCVGLFVSCIFFWSCSFSSFIFSFVSFPNPFPCVSFFPTFLLLLFLTCIFMLNP